MKSKKLLFLSLFILLFSCQEHSKNFPVRNPPSVIKSNEIHQFTIDSAMLKEKGPELRLLQTVIVQNLQVVDNHFVFALSKEDFVKQGLPENYYIQLMKDIKDANNKFEAEGIKDVDKILKESYRDLYKIMGKQKAADSLH